MPSPTVRPTVLVTVPNVPAAAAVYGCPGDSLRYDKSEVVGVRNVTAMGSMRAVLQRRAGCLEPA